MTAGQQQASGAENIRKVGVIVLIGFQHVGKTTLGRRLAAGLQMPFLDLDEQIVEWYETEWGRRLSCRAIARVHGEAYFREVESMLLKKTVETKKELILSVGGGAPMSTENQALMKEMLVVHVTADEEVVYQRLKENGWPSYFDPAESPCVSFKRLWKEREPIYRRLAHHTLNNDNSVSDSLKRLIRELSLSQS